MTWTERRNYRHLRSAALPCGMKFQVILHEGVVDEKLLPQLEEGLGRAYTAMFGGDAGDVAVDVTVVPKGRFFTAAKPSRSSLIGGSVPPGTAKRERTRLMEEITALWCEVTACSPNDVVVSISDAPA